MSAGARSLVDQIVRTRAELSEALADPDLSADRTRYADVNRRWSHLVEAFTLADRWEDATGRAAEAREMLDDDDDADIRSLLDDAELELAELEPRIREALIEPDPDDDRDTLVEIRAAAGGRRPRSSRATCSTSTPATRSRGA